MTPTQARDIALRTSFTYREIIALQQLPLDDKEQIACAVIAEGVQDQPRELEPVIMAPDKLPECVVTALVYRLACIEEEIQHFRAEIDKLEAEHEQLAKWKEAHDD